jgi:hypothetical protein
MKKLLSIVALCALSVSVFAQFTADPPQHRAPGFIWSHDPPQHHRLNFHFCKQAPETMQDHSAQDFINRAGITQPGQAVAVTSLVMDLRRAGVWTKLMAFYPFMGGTAKSCAQNLVSAQYTIIWHGNPGFDPSGITGDGNSYGDTQCAPSMADPNSFHLYGWVCLNASQSPGPIFGTGTLISRSPASCCYMQAVAGACDAWGPNAYSSIEAAGFTAGNFLMQRTDANTCAVHTDQMNIVSAMSSMPPAVDSVKVLGAPPVCIGYTSGSLRALSIGASLSDAEITAYFAAVNRFQAALGRSIP